MLHGVIAVWEAMVILLFKVTHRMKRKIALRHKNVNCLEQGKKMKISTRIPKYVDTLKAVHNIT